MTSDLERREAQLMELLENGVRTREEIMSLTGMTIQEYELAVTRLVMLNRIRPVSGGVKPACSRCPLRRLCKQRG